ncbi:DUF6186 family protein [Arthrobacter sp. ERGS1:01]|uniref:DUF6186 family protein n=1 Tax=Arthrobacter sp. ERGS1:01 TaxID=1704044 RepID=UPI000AF8548C|nr:DUF6186 family protein [Arthrobacter sp. ERGS1:01]
MNGTVWVHVMVVAGYVLVPVAGVALVVVARLWPAKLARLGELLAVVFRTRAARLTLLLFVWWMGWHFLVGD